MGLPGLSPTRGGAPAPHPLDVLLLSASYGAGHDQAAAAVCEGLAEIWPGCRTRQVDYLTLLDPTLQRLTQSLYIWSVKHFPIGWAAFYHGTSALAPHSGWQRRLNSLGLPGLRALIDAHRPRAIVCTYPLQLGVLSELRRRGESIPRLIAIITDHTIHSQWIHPHVDLYCVSAPEVAAGLAARGVPRSRIRVTGLPVRRAFRQPIERSLARAQLGLRPNEAHVLLVGGAYGMLGGVPAACRALSRLKADFRLTVVCGRDLELRENLEEIAASSEGNHIRVLGYVREIDELMAAADLLVGKAGGMTTSEALAMGLPLVIYRAIPGQEEANASYLCRHGAAVMATTTSDLCSCVGRLLAQPGERAAMSRACHDLARPEAALQVAREVRFLCA